MSPDNTISCHGRRIQLLASKERRSWVRCSVTVLEQFDGTLSVVFEQQHIASREAPRDPVQQRRQATKPSQSSTRASSKEASAKARRPKPIIPGGNHTAFPPPD